MFNQRNDYDQSTPPRKKPQEKVRARASFVMTEL